MNALIDGLYVRYSQILWGLDLWVLMLNWMDLILVGDVHLIGVGCSVILGVYVVIM